MTTKFEQAMELLAEVEGEQKEAAIETRRAIAAEIIKDSTRDHDGMKEIAAPFWLKDLSEDELELFAAGMRFAAELLADPHYEY